MPINMAIERDAYKRAWSRVIKADRQQQLEERRAVRHRGGDASPPSGDKGFYMVSILPPGVGEEVARRAGPPDGPPTGVPATSDDGAGPSTLPWAPREG